MFDIDQKLIESLRPNFSDKDVEQMKLYHQINKKYNDQMNSWFRERLKDHPVFGPLLAVQTPEIQKARNELSEQLLHNALYDGEWDAYISDLIVQGVTYAKMGMTFRSWYEVVAMVKEYLLPIVVKEHGSDNTKILDTLSGLSILTDYAMQGIAESYFIEKNHIIEAQRKKQEALIKELESFAYVVSHDLKSPLRGISKISEWLISDYQDKLDDSGKQSLELLKSRAQRLDNLIDGILQYSRLGRKNGLTEEIDVNKLIKDVIDFYDAEKAEFKLPENLPTMKFDRSKLNQVFSNLISNAIKYNDKKKAIVEVGFSEGPMQYQFWVSDNGPGIEPKYHDKVFVIFQTLHPKDEIESTGIGLSIVKKIVEDAGGNIRIESELGKGARFIFSLPRS